jgi:hypothetical protein
MRIFSFVEFDDKYQGLIAMQAIQNYKFDEASSLRLKIQFSSKNFRK